LKSLISAPVTLSQLWQHRFPCNFQRCFWEARFPPDKVTFSRPFVICSQCVRYCGVILRPISTMLCFLFHPRSRKPINLITQNPWPAATKRSSVDVKAEGRGKPCLSWFCNNHCKQTRTLAPFGGILPWGMWAHEILLKTEDSDSMPGSSACCEAAAPLAQVRVFARSRTTRFSPSDIPKYAWPSVCIKFSSTWNTWSSLCFYHCILIQHRKLFLN
jgi:hypothetical protein